MWYATWVGQGAFLPCTETSTIFLLLHNDLLGRALLILHLLPRIIPLAYLDLWSNVCNLAYSVGLIRNRPPEICIRQRGNINVREVLADNSLVVVVDSHLVEDSRRPRSCAMLEKPSFDFQ